MSIRGDIARILDIAESEQNAKWVVPTRYGRQVADVLLTALGNKQNRKHLTSDEAYASLVRHVVERSELRIAASRLDGAMADLIALCRQWLAGLDQDKGGC